MILDSSVINMSLKIQCRIFNIVFLYNLLTITHYVLYLIYFLISLSLT
jgi:hypothetical protein